MFDKNKSLWCGWAVHDASKLSPPPPASPPPEPFLPCFYFTGDTGWSPLLFAEIAATLCCVTLAALPIGAYEPRWMMAPQHTDPNEAVAIHTALRCRQFITRARVHTRVEFVTPCCAAGNPSACIGERGP